jgi:uridine kinase
MQITNQHEKLVARFKHRLVPWRKVTIAVDGRDDTGKSTLTRLPAWQLDMPAIETDLVLMRDAELVRHRPEVLGDLIDARHSLTRPVIVEGVLVLNALSAIAIDSDFMIYVAAEGREGSHQLRNQFDDYERAVRPRDRTDCIFRW